MLFLVIITLSCVPIRTAFGAVLAFPVGERPCPLPMSTLSCVAMSAGLAALGLSGVGVFLAAIWKGEWGCCGGA